MLALAGFAAAEIMDHMDYEFMRFIVNHAKSYATRDEFEFRKSVFADRYYEYRALNKELTTSQVGINFFSDHTTAEYEKLLGWKKETRRTALNFKHLDLNAIDYSVNWVEQGAVTPVKN